MIRNLAASAAMLVALSAPAFAHEAKSERRAVENEGVAISPEKYEHGSILDEGERNDDQVEVDTGDAAREIVNEKFEEGSALNEAATAKDEIDVETDEDAADSILDEQSSITSSPLRLAEANDRSDPDAPGEMGEEAIGAPAYGDPSVPAGVTEDAAVLEDWLEAEEEFETFTGDLEPGEEWATTDGPLPEQTSTERAEEILLEDEEITGWKQPEGIMQKGSAVEEHLERREQLDTDEDYSFGDEPMNTLED